MTDENDSPQKKKPKLASSAPPPITPLRGSGRIATIQRPPACPPEWSQWEMVGRVETWEAAALSINLEPRRIDRNKNSSFPDDKTYDLFVMRRRAVEVAPWRALGRNQLGVCLPNFVEWSISKGMDIPVELASMARPIEAPEVPAPEPVELVQMNNVEIETTKSAEPTKPLPVQRFQENEILRVIGELRYDAKALPKDTPGKNGAQAKVRAKLNFSTGKFNKAWERLSSAGDICKLK